MKNSVKNILQNTNVIYKLDPNTPFSVVAKTPRLLIRPVSLDDVSFYQNHLLGNTEVMGKFGAGLPRFFWPGTEETGAVNYAERRISNWVKRWTEGNPWSGYTVELKETGEKIGHVIIGGGELAYFFIPEAWNKGFGTEAVTALTNVILPELVKHGYHPGVSEINATVRIDNIPSQRVLEKSGLTSDKSINQRQFGEQVFDRYDYKVSVAKLVQNYDARLLEAPSSPLPGFELSKKQSSIVEQEQVLSHSLIESSSRSKQISFKTN